MEHPHWGYETGFHYFFWGERLALLLLYYYHYYCYDCYYCYYHCYYIIVFISVVIVFKNYRSITILIFILLDLFSPPSEFCSHTLDLCVSDRF